MRESAVPRRSSSAVDVPLPEPRSGNVVPPQGDHVVVVRRRRHRCRRGNHLWDLGLLLDIVRNQLPSGLDPPALGPDVVRKVAVVRMGSAVMVMVVMVMMRRRRGRRHRRCYFAGVLSRRFTTLD